MELSDVILYSQLNYYCREGFWHHVTQLAADGLSRSVNDPFLLFYQGLAALMQGKYQDCIRIVEPIKGQPEISIGALLMLIKVHGSFEDPDESAKTALNEILQNSLKSAGDKSIYYAALLCYFTQQLDKAREYCDRCLRARKDFSDYLSLRGWIELSVGRNIKDAVAFFDEALKNSSTLEKYPDAWLGRARHLELRRNPTGSIEVLNQAAALFPNLLPIQLERAKAHMMVKDWEACLDAAQRCTVIDHRCTDAIKYIVLYRLAFQGEYSEASGEIVELSKEIGISEPRNWKLLYDAALLFSRVCGRNLEVLQKCRNMIENALKIDENNVKLKTLLADLQRLSGMSKQALKTYRAAMETNQSSTGMLSGVIHTHVVEDEISDAAAQIDFLKEVHGGVGNINDLRFFEIYVRARTNKADKQQVLDTVSSIIESHLTSLEGLIFGPEYLIELDADFLMEVAEFCLEYAPSEPVIRGEKVDSSLRLLGRMLDSVALAVPGLTSALYLLGKVKYLAGENDAALNVLQQGIQKNSNFIEAHLMMAQIYAAQDDFKKASQALEVGLSYNFEVRDHALYHLIKGRIQKRSKDLNSAVTTLENALKLLPAADDTKRSGSAKDRLKLTESDRAAVYLELIDCYQMLNREAEASQLMTKAMEQFAGTRVERMLALSNANLALKRGDIDRAIQQLKEISPEQPNYIEARHKLADVYLYHKKDKRAFAATYREMVEQQPTPAAYVLLGDAYMSIQEDHELARKIGAAYVKSHNYNKAVTYYETALKRAQGNTSDQQCLRSDLAELLLKLKQYEKCMKVLNQGLENTSMAGTDVHELISSVRYLMLLSKLHQVQGDFDESIQTLIRAKEQQSKVIKRGVTELLDSVQEQKQLAADICAQLGEYYQSQRDFEKAIEFYQESLQNVNKTRKVMQSLGFCYLVSGQQGECQKMCDELLAIDANDEDTILILADLMHQRNEVESGLQHAKTIFQQMLAQNPCNYDALSKMIDLLRRVGDLEQAEALMQEAGNKNAMSEIDPGHSYCRGLLEWYTSDPNEALQCFNRARKDADWGERALYNMIEICLNPDNEIMGGEVFEQGEAVDNTTANAEDHDSQALMSQTVDKLMAELSRRFQGDYRYHLVECFVLLSSKNKQKIEQALESFQQMASDNEEIITVGAVLGMARAHQMLKQNQKAKAQLKTVVSHPWNFEDAEYLEQCWLLLADTYINQSKYDVASEILRTCLQHNASCMKAYEYLGFIREKEQRWAEAATNYERVWRLCRKRNPVIGFKLAFNYLKSKRYVDAIDVCHRVLTLYPEYPKIRKEILDKARSNIRI